MKIEDITPGSLTSSRSRAAEMLGSVADAVRAGALAVRDCLRDGGAVFACGNGGSATQAAHFAGELVGRFRLDREALRVFALSDNPAVVTALSNDYEFADVYARQLSGLGRSGDVLFALSTSGNSANIVKACRVARERGLHVIGLTGEGGGRMQELCDTLIEVPSGDTPAIQEVHLMAIHVVCEAVEAELFG
jgi:D-sedoheptulose 7-phosphate isomerase